MIPPNPDHEFRAFIILKVLNDHPNITGYRVKVETRKKGFSLHASMVYQLIHGLESQGCILHGTDEHLLSLSPQGKQLLLQEEVKVRQVLFTHSDVMVSIPSSKPQTIYSSSTLNTIVRR